MVAAAHDRGHEGRPRHRLQPHGAAVLLRHEHERHPDDYIEGSGDPANVPLPVRPRRLQPLARQLLRHSGRAGHPDQRIRPAVQPARRAGHRHRRLRRACADHLPERPGHQHRPARAGHPAEGVLVPRDGAHPELERPVAVAARRLHGRPEGPEHRVARRAAGARAGLRELGRAGRLRRLPHRHDQARRLRLLELLPPDHPQQPGRQGEEELLHLRRVVRRPTTTSTGATRSLRRTAPRPRRRSTASPTSPSSSRSTTVSSPTPSSAASRGRTSSRHSGRRATPTTATSPRRTAS